MRASKRRGTPGTDTEARRPRVLRAPDLGVPLRELEESRIAAGRSTLVASWGVKADAESGRVAVALVMADGDVCGFVADLDGDTIQ